MVHLIEPRVTGKSVVSRDPTVVISRILDAAQAEFMATGYEAASTNRITAAFQGSKATIFRYFPTKEAMLKGVVRRIAGRWQETLAYEKMPDLAPRAWLELFAARALKWIMSDESLFLGRLGVSEGHKIPSFTRVFEEAASEPLRCLLSQQFASWTRIGLMASSDPKRDSALFLDLLIGGPVSRALYGIQAMSEKEQRAHIRRGVEIFLNGCAKPKARRTAR